MTTTSTTTRGPYKLPSHPMEPQSKELVAQGLNDSQIVEELIAPPKVVARVRRDAGFAPAPRSTWRRKPHPKATKIGEFLEDGFNDAEISRRTGADVSAIARMRAEGGYGKPTMGRKPRQHPRDAEIRALLAEHGNKTIAAMLGVDRAAVRRIRGEAGITAAPRGYASAEDKWRAHVRPVDGGHLEWTGERANSAGTPVMRFKEESFSPAAIAFEIRHGRKPEGYVRADCTFKQCVAPDHVNDEAGRHQARLEARERNGLGELPAKCAYGHDMAVHGKLESDGRAYCGMCKLLDKRAQRDPSQPRRTRPRPTSVEEAFRAHLEPADGDHVRWTGSLSHTTPTIRFENHTYSAYKVAFRIHHGRDPRGTVTSGCEVPACVAGGCLLDQPMRAANQRADAAFNRIFGDAA